MLSRRLCAVTSSAGPFVGPFIGSLALSAGLAHAQADFPALFVSNNGNLEGSITSFAVEPDGALTLVDRLVTGTRPSTSVACGGCNAIRVSLTPDGRFLATMHAPGGSTEDVVVTAVAPDGTLSEVERITASEQGLDIQWINDAVLATATTTFGPGNLLRLYNWDGQDLSLSDAVPSGEFFTDMELHPNGRWLYTNDSFQNTVRLFEILPTGGANNGPSAVLVQTLSIPVFGTQLAVDPSGRFLYAAGGISAGGNAFSGFTIDQTTGELSLIVDGPGAGVFTSPGASPKNFAVVPVDGGPDLLYVGHGTDATVRGFSIDPATGVPTSTGVTFDVGTQGTLRELDAGVLNGENVLFVVDQTDSSDGLEGPYLFDVADAGTLTPGPGSPTPTDGISPEDAEFWPGPSGPQPCSLADLVVPFGFIDLSDVDAFIAAFNVGDALADVAFPFGIVDLSDVDAFIASFLGGCP
ncbi:MAG: beta-propeller fold lactonase family protein [Planctomycetota bacterium]